MLMIYEQPEEPNQIQVRPPTEAGLAGDFLSSFAVCPKALIHRHEVQGKRGQVRRHDRCPLTVTIHCLSLERWRMWCLITAIDHPTANRADMGDSAQLNTDVMDFLRVNAS